MTRSQETHSVEWRGIGIKITYESNWLGKGDDLQIAHLEVQSLTPMKAALPITETGYRSHFLAPQEVDRVGGPVAFVVAWLNEAARYKGWKETEEKARQLNLF